MKIHSEQEMLEYGQRLAASLKAPAVIELIGDVGAGKTTLVRGLATGLGITEPVTSPSFSISKRYAMKNGGELVHYDFYRLEDPGLMAEELAEAISDPNNIVVIEWGASVAELLPADHIIISIDILETVREIIQKSANL